MIGFEDKPEKSAEICIFELKGSNINGNTTKIGYGVHPFGDESINDEFYEDEFNININEWNVYGVEWLQDKICFYSSLMLHLILIMLQGIQLDHDDVLFMHVYDKRCSVKRNI